VPPYSPERRTALVLTGTGAHGAYHAGAVRALQEAGVKIDLVAGHGAGAMIALCSAIDGGAKLWDADGMGTSSSLRRAYRWRAGLRVAGVGLAAAGAVLLSPLLVLVAAAAMYAASLLCSLVSLPDASAWLIDRYRWVIEHVFLPPWIPTIVPRALVLTLLTVFAVLVVSATRAVMEERSRRRVRGAFWWRLVGAPIDSAEPASTLRETLWNLVRGGQKTGVPSAAEIGRKYAEMLTENLGQPGFREVLVGVHDVDARRDLVGAVVSAEGRVGPDGRRRSPLLREPDSIDLTAQRDLIAEFLTAAMKLPVASAPHLVTFPADSYWQGETHRLCDRPELIMRLSDDLASMGVEQLIIVSAAPPPATPHGLRSRPLDLRARMGEMVRSLETVAVRDAWMGATARFASVFVIRPEHNPIGPFEFASAYDESSDRRRTVSELIDMGYEEANRQFIEPVVATDERADAIGRRA